ncbi:MAG: DUF429 domain-containing protein [Candidatus Limnocylindria bacterium]
MAGVDISGRAAHVVVMDGGTIASAGIWPTDDLVNLADDLAACEVVAIDSPDRWSLGAIPEHGGLSPKFVAARCAEFELARSHRYWVPWVTPLEPQSVEDRAKYAWMARGMELFRLLHARSTAIEVYPNSIYRRLAKGSVVPPKSQLAGLAMRVELLRGVGVKAPHLEMWSHDSLDAAAAATVAWAHSQGWAERVSCDHDGSAMWLPPAAV